jgi:TonB family protein
MTQRERLGRLVLLEETEASAYGREYRAARLGPAGLDRVVSVLRFSPTVSAHSEVTRRLMEEARVVARLHNPGLVRVLGVGRTDQVFYISSEFVEGRTLGAVFEKCRREQFPFAADHALMVASRAASALEYVHGKKSESGHRLFHGLLTPARLVVTYHGEIKLKGLGMWDALRGGDLIGPDDRLRLTPEQAKGDEGDPLSDVYALGLVLLEALTGSAPDGSDPLARLAPPREPEARREASLPEPLVALLARALARQPAQRFASVAEFRKAIDALLFSGDFAPTTFDLAFFMHTLFRDEMERETSALNAARQADYSVYLGGEGQVAISPTTTPPEESVAPDTATLVEPPPATGTDDSGPLLDASDRREEPETETWSPPAQAPTPEPIPFRDVTPRSSRETTRQAAAHLSLGGPASASRQRRLLWLVIGVLGAVVVGGTAGGLYFVGLRSATTTPPSTLDAVEAAHKRVLELEARVAELEREKEEAASRAAESARVDLEQQAAAGGRTADPAAVAAAQEEARRRVRTEQEAKQRDELNALAARRSEAERLARTQANGVAPTASAPSPLPTSSGTTGPSGLAPAASAAPPPSPPAPVPTPTPAEVLETPSVTLTPTPGPPSTPAPTPSAAGAAAAAVVEPESVPRSTLVSPGQLVDVDDPAVIPPVLLDQDPLRYPPIALQRQLEGTVELKVLVDERGVVRQVTMVAVSPGGVGFEREAIRHARTRRYRPAKKGNVPVKVWVPLVVNFRNPGR